ncbi:sulfurtransferase [Mesorhizobium sp. YR577]|uniref:sulfurtransferase n=1 Tax=Mesorhizobium sp. YR577 TaxID=1884373 RepID=UPI0008E8AEB2|nr:sulfurtransferase [Mesorhizobium sp. YR577]SFU22394.1 thiosulfate/3-mercaptopyruvate sulfurtransferase [Mesorhizobium sp. YR577]
MDDYLVEPAWLSDHLGDPSVVVLDCIWYVPEAGKSGLDEYRQGHIPTAQYIDLNAVSDARSPFVNMLPPAEQFAAEVGRLGIGDNTMVVVYDSSYVSARLWWMFRLFGHDKVRILNGGMRRWTSEGRAVETGGPAAVAPAIFTARPPRDEVAAWPEVLGAVNDKSATLLDARTPGRFTGEMSSGYPGVAGGHMPGAINVSWNALIEQKEPFTFVSPMKARELFEATGVDLSRPAIATCGSGVTAAIIAFQLERIGKHDWRLYDASWHEWGQCEDLPKESV